MKIRTVLIICILWILGVLIYFFSTAEGRKESYGFDNDACSLSDGEYLITGTERLDQFLFDIDKFNKVKAVYAASNFADDASIWEVTAHNGYIYMLLQTKAPKGPLEVSVYNILKLDEDMARVASSGWFDLSQPGDISDLTISDEEDLLTVTQISAVEPSVVYVYPLEVSDLDVKSDADENNVRHVYTLNYSDYFESETGGEIFFASYHDGVLEKYENVSDALPEKYYSTKAEKLYENKILSLKQLIYINSDLFMYCISAIILGIATIFAIYVALIRRNRVAYLIFDWEIMMVIVFITTVWLNGRNQKVFTIAGIVFVVGSILGIIALLLQAMDLSIFLNSLIKVSRGRQDIFKPRVVGGDMNALWNALFDLIRAIKSMNYNIFRIYEGYYRFAPKMIESYMAAASIADVQPDGNSVNTITASLAMLHSRMRPDSEVVKSIFAQVANLQENQMGALLCTNADVSDVEMIFPEENKSISDFVLKISKDFIQNNSCILIHHDSVKVSVVGDNRQNAVVADCETAKKVFADIDRLNQLDLKFVMTESALKHEANDPLCRYIGYLSMDGGQKIKLYEMLDCLLERERRLKVDSKSMFEDAIEHIRTKDYYYARNIFAKIIRINPDDEVARQYLFKCEDSLSLDNDKEIDFGLNR